MSHVQVPTDFPRLHQIYWTNQKGRMKKMSSVKDQDTPFSKSQRNWLNEWTFHDIDQSKNMSENQ